MFRFRSFLSRLENLLPVRSWVAPAVFCIQLPLHLVLLLWQVGALVQTLKKDSPADLCISTQWNPRCERCAKASQTLRRADWKIHLFCVCCRVKPGLGVWFPLVIMTGTHKFETNFKLEPELLMQILSADETLTSCCPKCPAEPRGKFCWFLPQCNEAIPLRIMGTQQLQAVKPRESLVILRYPFYLKPCCLFLLNIRIK